MSTDLETASPALRTRLADGNFLALARAEAPPGVTVRSPWEMDHSLRSILRGLVPGQDLHLFGYGSLMWNLGLAHTSRFKARVHGWHRRFCIRSLVGRARRTRRV